ncbi:MAG: N-acetyltransferase [Alteromonadaceae bacterium TMED7]|nr:hypothetical protein [Alteromonadaceae bacterium]RPH16758.1 MAG: N-acetyltransferase [Alteromonadaceae bacterium TMED7]|tara:strand:+ start:14679 stop:15614 length:936 start_codon:yes stop_codon:yes gene_type:complete
MSKQQNLLSTAGKINAIEFKLQYRPEPLMTKTAFTVREMREADLPICLEFTQQVKWPHRMGDWQLHFSQGNGSIIENAEGDIVGCILWWDYSQQLATVGLVVVPEHMQGNGLGRKLMDTVMSQTGERNLQLVATVAGKRLYQQCGFEEAALIYQVQGQLAGTVAPLSSDASIQALDTNNLADIIALDVAAYGCSRASLLTAVAQQGKGLVAYRDGKAVGYAMLRTSGHGQTLGPVLADDDDTAKALISQLLTSETGFIRFDLTERAKAIQPWLESLGLAQVDEVSLMVKGEFVPAGGTGAKIYSLISQAFG